VQKTRSEVSGSTRKPFPQKKTGRARAGTLHSAPHMNGGGRAFPPKPRDWSYSLPKQVVRMGLKSALSAKLAQGKLKIIDAANIDSHKTKAFQEIAKRNNWLVTKVEKTKLTTANPQSKKQKEALGVLIVDGFTIEDPKFQLAVANTPSIRVIDGNLINVYDILKQEKLVLTKAAVQYLQDKRLKN